MEYTKMTPKQKKNRKKKKKKKEKKRKNTRKNPKDRRNATLHPQPLASNPTLQMV